MTADDGHGVGETAQSVSTALDTANEDSASTGFRKGLAIAKREARIAHRTRWSVGLALLFALFSGVIVLFSGSQIGPQRYASLVATLAELSVYLVPLAALAFGYNTVVGARETGTLDSLYALPIPRSTVVIGMYVGRAATLAAALVIGFSLGGVLVINAVGIGGWGLYAYFMAVVIGAGWAFLAISLLVSTLAPEKTYALGTVLLLWVWFVLVHDLVALAAIASFDLPDIVMAGLVLANPADLLRVAVLSLLPTTSGGLGSVLVQSNLSPALIAVGFLAWIVVPLAIAGVVARRV
jgi:Cu-processing system permease protein